LTTVVMICVRSHCDPHSAKETSRPCLALSLVQQPGVSEIVAVTCPRPDWQHAELDATLPTNDERLMSSDDNWQSSRVSIAVYSTNCTLTLPAGHTTIGAASMGAITPTAKKLLPHPKSPTGSLLHCRCTRPKGNGTVKIIRMCHYESKKVR